MYDIVVVDGNNMANKAFFLNNFMTYDVDGKTYKTGVLYGMLNMVLSVVKSDLLVENPMVFCIWDTPRGSAIRGELNSAYKAQRVVTEADRESKREFYAQAEFAKKELFALRMYQGERVGYEADDLIYTFIKHVLERTAASDKKILILSEDKDFRSLISDRVSLYSISKKTVWDVPYFIDTIGLNKPEYFTDYLALVGDASDNYNGVKGIGDKSARDILNDPVFQTSDKSPIQAILDDPQIIHELHANARTKGLLRNNLEALKLNYSLAMFYEVPDVTFKYRKPDDSSFDKAVKMLKKYNMKSLLSDTNLAALRRIV